MHRPGWIWTALPPGSRRIAWLGDPGLAEALREAGLDPTQADVRSGGDPAHDAALVARDDAGTGPTAAQLARTAASGIAAIAVGPSASPSLRPVSRPARALQLLASPATAVRTLAVAGRLERALAREGLEVLTVRTGDRSLPRYGLGPGGWLKRRRLPGGAIVIGSVGQRPPSVIEEAIAAAARDLGRPLRRLSAEVFPSGKLALYLAGRDAERYFLSISAGDASSLDRSEAAIRAILGADAPESLRERIVEPLAAGSVGPVRFVLEPMAPGRHPVWMTSGLWEQAVEFLVGLHRLPRRSPGVSLPPAWPDLPTAIEIIGRDARADDRRLLDRIHRTIGDRVTGLEAGGGHGDFFTSNLLVERGNLRSVLDWEWASRDSLPLLDLFDLRAQLGWRRRRGLRVGQNFTDVLWPLARQGGDSPLLAYCRALEVPTETRVLEGLAMAHWLVRTARLGSINPRRLADPQWRRANVAAPLATIAAEGMSAPRR